MIPLEAIKTPEDPLERRAIIVANALALDGVSAWPGNPESRAEFESILGEPPAGGYWDLDRPFSVSKKQGISTCGLVARGIERRCSVLDPNLYAPYSPGSAFSSADNRGLLDFARANDCLSQSGDYASGDMIVIGEGLSTHIFTCVGLEGDSVYGIDGGQVDLDHGGLQCIKKTRRDRSTMPYVEHVLVARLPWAETCYRPKALSPKLGQPSESSRAWARWPLFWRFLLGRKSR